MFQLASGGDPLSQQLFVALVLVGHNVALLGKAGTGKTYIMQRVVSILSQTRHLNQSSDILQHSQNRPTGDRWLKF